MKKTLTNVLKIHGWAQNLDQDLLLLYIWTQLIYLGVTILLELQL